MRVLKGTVLALAIVGLVFIIRAVTAGKGGPALSARTSDALTVIRERVSVRRYLNKPVSRQDLETLVRAGMAAPSAGDKRPWAFVVVTRKDLLVALARDLEHGKMLAGAAAAIVTCGVMDRTLPGKEWEFWVQDCSAASENILLAAQALRLGAVWVGLYPVLERSRRVQIALNIPDDVIPLNVISVGHPVGVEKSKDKYDPTNIHWETW